MDSSSTPVKEEGLDVPVPESTPPNNKRPRSPISGRVSPTSAKKPNTSSSSSSSQAEETCITTSDPVKLAADLSECQKRIQILETDLSYALFDLNHERQKWNFFRKKGKRKNVWEILVGVEDALAAQAPVAPAPAVALTVAATLGTSSSSLSGEPVTPTSSQKLEPTSVTSPMVVDTSGQLEALRTELWDMTMKRDSLQTALTLLQTEKDELHKNLSVAEMKRALGNDEILEHSLYQAAVMAYINERSLSCKLTAQIAQLQEELTTKTAAAGAAKKETQEQEERRRQLLQSMIYEKDTLIQQKEDDNRNLIQSQKTVEVLQGQLSETQKTLKDLNQVVNSLRTEVEKAQKLSKTRMGESELSQEYARIGTAYQGMSEQNVRLLRTIEEKDKRLALVQSEKVKLQQMVTLAKAECDKAKALATQQGEQLRERQDEWITKLQTTVDTLTDEQSSLTEEVTALDSTNSRLESELNEARLKAEEHVHRYTSMKTAFDATVSRVDGLARQATTENDERRKLADEVQILTRRLEKLKEKVVVDGSTSELRKQVQALRNVLNCNICSTRRKNCIITKCFHIFCNECVEANLRDRNRKCPQCNIKFSETDVRPVYLTEK